MELTDEEKKAIQAALEAERLRRNAQEQKAERLRHYQSDVKARQAELLRQIAEYLSVLNKEIGKGLVTVESNETHLRARREHASVHIAFETPWPGPQDTAGGQVHAFARIVCSDASGVWMGANLILAAHKGSADWSWWYAEPTTDPLRTQPVKGYEPFDSEFEMLGPYLWRQVIGAINVEPVPFSLGLLAKLRTGLFR